METRMKLFRSEAISKMGDENDGHYDKNDWQERDKKRTENKWRKKFKEKNWGG